MAAETALSLTLNVGGIRVSLTSADPTLPLAVSGASEQFLDAGGEADACLRASWADLREPSTGDRIFDSGSVWQLYRQGADLLFRFASPVYGKIPYKEASFSSDFKAGEVSLHRNYFRTDEPASPLEYPLDELLVMNLLALGRGIEVHALGVEDADGRGYLFLGQSGAGKTTTARLWEPQRGIKILSDDRIILRSLEGRIWMYGTPWHGEAELACSTRTPLTQIFFLGRGVENEIVPMSQPAAVARLMACSFVPFHSPTGLDYTLEFLQQVTSEIPCAELRFVPDDRVVDFVREHVR
jgi:hypothetical protein